MEQRGIMTLGARGRLLLPEPGSAAGNMSLDQAILESVDSAAVAGAAGIGGVATEPTLRFYTWASPTLSLGYFQSHRDSSPRFQTLERVRRSTGGGAILHHHELTYSLTVPVPARDHGARTELYHGVHLAIASVLSQFGVTARRYGDGHPRWPGEDSFLCFQRRTAEDLIVSGYKVLGSAQRRSKRAVLQHGSLLLRASEFAPELPGVFDLTSVQIEHGDLVQRLSQQIGALLAVNFQTGAASDSERSRAEEITAQRFSSPAWWSRR
ncbi:lipoate--protein ligase family protein [Stieleria sp. TO1_6]|uniref:lipoate--protein ligase family protein n=1 Tax=Stieleria tagensis TaxID=2956795 RepID=UPI00209ADD83|nr:lipoate--protein ligase family protein [Stieleria tagensis]MCO8124201.1 lipoate--protein ligase family protein [Stieleria tagensis]